MANTKIEWTDKVWNPITGCSSVSEGCAHCYAARMAKRLAGRFGYPADEPFRVTFHSHERLMEPLGWKKPQWVFVCSMGDFFHDGVQNWMRDSVMTVIASLPRHTFMLLTKRPGNAVRYFSRSGSRWSEGLPNVWMGVTAENQARVDERIPELLKLTKYFPVLFVSVEPALGPNVLPEDFLALGRRAWVICGGESGLDARPMHPDWVRGLRGQCVSAGIPFFFKQWGEWITVNEPDEDKSEYINKARCYWGDGKVAVRVGKKAAGRLLDGREWNEFPSRIERLTCSK